MSAAADEMHAKLVQQRKQLEKQKSDLEVRGGRVEIEAR